MSSWDVCIVTWHWYLRACCVLCVVVALRRLVVLVAPVIPWNPESGCTSIPWRFEILIVKHKYKDNIDGNRLKQGWWWQATCPASYFLFPPPPLTLLAPAAHPLVETKETIGSKSVFWMCHKATLLSQKSTQFQLDLNRRMPFQNEHGPNFLGTLQPPASLNQPTILRELLPSPDFERPLCLPKPRPHIRC